jgi:hypothetical protein
LALAVGLGKEPVLPHKLLKELLPGVQGALFKLKDSGKAMPAFCFKQSFALRTAYSTRNSGTSYAGFLFPRKFRAKNCVLNPKLGDWEDIHINWKIENRHEFKEL